MVKLLGHPEWATDPALGDAATRSARGDLINAKIREWAKLHPVDELVARAQYLGVPMARYNSPEQVLSGHHENARQLFGEMKIPDQGAVRIQTAPFRFGSEPLPVPSPPPNPGSDQFLMRQGWDKSRNANYRATA